MARVCTDDLHTAGEEYDTRYLCDLWNYAIHLPAFFVFFAFFLIFSFCFFFLFVLSAVMLVLSALIAVSELYFLRKANFTLSAAQCVSLCLHASTW